MEAGWRLDALHGFLAWDLGVDSIPGCLAFEFTREYLDKNGKVESAWGPWAPSCLN